MKLQDLQPCSTQVGAFIVFLEAPVTRCIHHLLPAKKRPEPLFKFSLTSPPPKTFEKNQRLNEQHLALGLRLRQVLVFRVGKTPLLKKDPIEVNVEKVTA